MLLGSRLLLFRCTVHRMTQRVNNLIVLAHGASYCAVVQCLVYDCDNNDPISVHDSESGLRPVGSHHWVVDNVIVGNEGAEEGVDFASPGGAYDVKVINNRIQCTAVPALSARLNGTAGGGITASKIDEFVWLLNNIVAGGCKAYGLATGGFNQAAVGNIL